MEELVAANTTIPLDSIKLGYSFKKYRLFTEPELIKMAVDCGDMNPVHHDASLAHNSRFGSIIASGSAISAMFSALIPTHFSKFSPLLGLEMSFKFSAPIYPNVQIIMEWTIDDVVEKTDNTLLVSLSGRVTDSDGKLLVSGMAKVILVSSF